MVKSIMDMIDRHLHEMAESNEWSQEKLNYMLSKQDSICYYICVTLDNQYQQYAEAFDNSTLIS